LLKERMLAWKRKNVTLKIESDSSIGNPSRCTITYFLKKFSKTGLPLPIEGIR
jgi:hypothetical protein